jgi:hypothetical protein
LRLRLEDQGEGWFWELPSIEVEVVAQARVHSRPFYRVVFGDPGVGACPGAWLSPRWVGHEISREGDITALLWLASGEERPDKPPRDVPHSARVACREVS